MDPTDRANGTPSPDTRGEADATVRLLERAREGDREALNDLFARHIPVLRRWATGRLPRRRAIYPTRTILCRKPSFRHLRE